MFKLIIIVTYFWFILIHQVACKIHFELRRFDLCNNTQGYFHLIGNGSTSNNILSFHGDWDVKLPLDENIGVMARVESKVTKTLYIDVFTIHEKNLCQAAHTFLGELWFSIERKIGHPEGVCPIPARKYSIKHHEVDFKTMKLQTFPYGTLRVTLNVEDNRNRARLLTCLIAELENVKK